MIQVNTGFQINAPVAIDDRFLLSKSDMVGIDDNVMPEIYPCWCTDDNKMYIYNKYNEFDDQLGRFRAFEGGSGGTNTDVSHSSVNGNVKVDGTDVIVYDDTEVRKLATHDNREILDKISVSDSGELLYNNDRIGLYFYTSSSEIDVDVTESTQIFNLSELISGSFAIISSELLLQNKSSENDAIITVMDSGVELMSLTLSPNEIQKYRLGSSGTIKVYANGLVYSKLDISYYRSVAI